MSTETTCKDCGETIAQVGEKALDGTYAVVWTSSESGWVCDQTSEEHRPVPPFTGVPGYETDHAGNPMCGHDFMAGTICTDEREHDGGHSATCQVCGGDWVNETCTCQPYGDDEDEEDPDVLMDPVEALTYAILAINTDQEPTATSGNDLLYLECNAERALAMLVNLREWVIAQGEDLPEWIFEKKEV